MAASDATLFETATDAIVVTDDDARIDAFNAAAERMFGYRASDVIGDDVGRLIVEDAPTPVLERRRRPGSDREARGRRATGELFPVSFACGEIVEGSRRRVVTIFRDLSEAKAAAVRMRSLAARLEQLSQLYLVGEIGAGLAHELNQPLSAIATYAQAAKRMLEHDILDVRMLAEACEKIDEQARRAGRTVHDVRRLIREPELQAETLDVNRIVDELVPLIETDAGLEGIGVRLELAPGLHPVRGNAIQLQQAVLNLVHNAIEAMQDCTLEGRELRIRTTAHAGAENRVSIIDCGPGVPDSVGERVFDPFVTTKKERLGLGLSTTRAIAKAHGGRLAYERGSGAETHFVLILPTAGGG